MADGTNVDGSEANSGEGTSNDGSGEGTHWTETLNDDLKGNEALKEIKDINSLAGNYIKLQEGKPVVPESIEGYELDVPEGIKTNDEEIKAFKEKALELGLTADQLKGLADINFQNVLNQTENYNNFIETTKTETEKALKTDWGEGYDGNCEVAEQALTKFFPEEVCSIIRQTGLHVHKDFVAGMYEIGKHFKGDSFDVGGKGESGGKTTGDVFYDNPTSK